MAFDQAGQQQGARAVFHGHSGFGRKRRADLPDASGAHLHVRDRIPDADILQQ